jgi:hypothetical protein
MEPVELSSLAWKLMVSLVAAEAGEERRRRKNAKPTTAQMVLNQVALLPFFSVPDGFTNHIKFVFTLCCYLIFSYLQ